MTRKKSKESSKMIVETPATSLPADVKKALSNCNNHLTTNFSGISDPSGTLRYMVLRDMGNLMPLLMRCSSAIAVENRLGLGQDDWESVNEQLGVFTANWLNAWRAHVHDTGNWRSMFTDICHNGVCGADDEQKAWMVMADAVLRMLVLAPVYIDVLGAQAFDDVQEGIAQRAMQTVCLAGWRKPIRRDVLEFMVYESQINMNDRLRKLGSSSEELLRFGRPRRWLTNILRRMASAVSGRKSLGKRLTEMQERRAELETQKETTTKEVSNESTTE